MNYVTLMMAALLSNYASIGFHRHQPELPGAPPQQPASFEVPEEIQTKQGVILRGLEPRMYPVIQTAQEVWQNHGARLTITSGLDGKHGKDSLHYAGRALDFRTRDLDRLARAEAARELQTALGDDFRVLLERDHIHVEHDPPDAVHPSRAAELAERPR